MTATGATDVSHGMHAAVKPAEAGSKARAMSGAPQASHRGGAASPNMRAVSAMKSRAPSVHRCTFAMSRRALTMGGTEVLCMCRCLAGTVRITHEPAEIQPIVVRDFAPPLSGLMQRRNIIEALASGVCEQMRLL
jgi:hypothetical protein